MIVVTGAAGFIGSNVVADLNAAGVGPIAAVDWFTTDERWRNLGKRVVAHFVRPDVLVAFLDRHRSDIGAIIHMGAISATTERDVDLLVERNINYTVRLWDWCAVAEVPFIYASSAATYGSREKGFIDDESIPALRALRPLNAYGWSKMATDLIFAQRVAAGEAKPPQWVGLKFFNAYGPNEYHKGGMRSVANKLFDALKRDDPLLLFKSYRRGIADGEQRRDFVYVKDCSSIILRMLESSKTSGIFNVGTGTARSFLDVADAMTAIGGRRRKVEFIDVPEVIRDRYQYFTEADTSKLRRALPDVRFHSLEDGIGDYMLNYLQTADPYR